MNKGHFFQRGNTDGQQTHEKMLSLTNHQGNAGQDHHEKSLHTCQKAIIKIKHKQQALARMWIRGILCTLSLGMWIGVAAFGCYHMTQQFAGYIYEKSES